MSPGRDRIGYTPCSFGSIIRRGTRPSPAERAKALNLSCATIQQGLRDCHERGMPGLFGRTEYPRGPYTPERIIVTLVSFK